MNQTKKRLAIIKLAISVTDTETIQLQVLKLSLLKTDTKIQEILSVLEKQNYVQAQKLISAYIESPIKEVLQRASQNDFMLNKKDEDEKDNSFSLQEKIQDAKDKTIIEEFELFTVDSQKDLNQSQEIVNYDAYLDIDHSSIKDISIDTSEHDTSINIEEQHTDFEDMKLLTDKKQTDTIDNQIQEESQIPITSLFTNKEESTQIDVDIKLHTNREDNIYYESISDINEKLQNMHKRYPPKYCTNRNFLSVDTWLTKISNHNYSETEIEKMIVQVKELVQTDKSEAAQLLLATASTESKYAQFILARALYKGVILQQNLNESFKIIKQLALRNNYPEALCDLAQFYEYGIGTDKDKVKAMAFYKEAMNLGIQRAKDHYYRIEKKNKGIFSFFRK